MNVINTKLAGDVVMTGNDAEVSKKVTIIRPSRKLRLPNFAELWEYRELFRVLIERDIRVRYKQTVLGFAWAILQPAMTMVVFTIFFGNLAKMPSDGLPYSIFVYASLLPWIFFSNSVLAASGSLINSANLVGKVYFPRLMIPFSSIGAGMADFVVASSILLLMMLYYGIGWSLNLLMVPVLTFGVVLAALGVGTLLSALATNYRDFRYVVPFMVQLWMFATPVAYPSSIVPSEWRWLLNLNPMTGLIEGFRSALLDRPFDTTAITISFLAVAVIFAIGVGYFEKVERRFADVI